MKIIFCLFYFISKICFAAELSCPKGSYRVKSHPRSSYHRADGTFVSATYVRTFCKELSAGEKFWLDKIKEGNPSNWSLKREISKKWNESERQRVLEVLSELPELFWLSAIKGIYRFSQSRDKSNPGVQNQGSIVLYDAAFDSNQKLRRVLAHELSHILYEEISESQIKQYYVATGWNRSVRARTVVWSGRKSGYVDSDGEFSPTEDFANNIEYYLFEPETLQRVTPSAYVWIKKIYGDKLKLKGR